jgi:hypothetical protein
VLRCIHIYTEIQAIKGHIDRFNGDSQQKIENESIAKERQKTQFVILFLIAVVVLVKLYVTAAL